MARRIDRRTFLRGAGGVCVGLPFLEAMSSHAGGTADPKRIVFFFTNNGTVHQAWRPTGTETAFTLGEILLPIEPWQDRLLVLSGIDMESSYHGPGSGDPHMPGMGHLLTGTEMVDTGPGQYDKMGGGISVDQTIADQVGAETKFPSLHFGIQARVDSSSPWNSLSYRGPNEPVDPEDDPAAAFERVFGELGDGNDGLAILRSQRHSVLDAVKSDIDELNGKLGHADRILLEQHLDSIRQVEHVIDTSSELGGNCMLPAVPDLGGADVHDNDSSPMVWQLQTELLVMALACDLTRVATLQWRGALGGQAIFTWLGHTETHHVISHKGDSDAVGRQQMIDINTWFAQRYAYLLELLDAVQESGGTLLDNTVVVWCNELARGNAHDRRDMPYVLAGSCGGALRTGRHVQYAGDYHNNLLVSLARTMDVDIDTFGNPAYCTGELPNLT